MTKQRRKMKKDAEYSRTPKIAVEYQAVSTPFLGLLPYKG